MIRVSDDNENSGERKVVAQNTDHYKSEIFGSNNRNLVSNVKLMRPIFLYVAYVRVGSMMDGYVFGSQL